MRHRRLNQALFHRRAALQVINEQKGVRTMTAALMCKGPRYFFSTCLSLWNKRLVGKEHGVLGMGPFPGAALSCPPPTQHAMSQAA